MKSLPTVEQVKNGGNAVVFLRAKWTDANGVDHVQDYPVSAVLRWTGLAFINEAP